MDDKLFEKLRIAFRYGIKVMERQPGKEECMEVFFDKAIAVINRLYPKKGKK